MFVYNCLGQGCHWVQLRPLVCLATARLSGNNCLSHVSSGLGWVRPSVRHSSGFQLGWVGLSLSGCPLSGLPVIVRPTSLGCPGLLGLGCHCPLGCPPVCLLINCWVRPGWAGPGPGPGQWSVIVCLALGWAVPLGLAVCLGWVWVIGFFVIAFVRLSGWVISIRLSVCPSGSTSVWGWGLRLAIGLAQ